MPRSRIAALILFLFVGATAVAHADPTDDFVTALLSAGSRTPGAAGTSDTVLAPHGRPHR